MAILSFASLALLGLHTIGSFAAQDQPWKEIVKGEYEIPGASSGATKPATPNLDIVVNVSFPDSDFGVKLVNNHATSAHISIANGEVEPISVRMIGGSLWPLDTTSAPTTGAVAIRNLTTQNLNTKIPAGENQTFTYSFATELHPQDLKLLLAAIIHDSKGVGYQVEAFNGTVSVVEAPISIFDPQILFLYVFLLACFTGTCYFIYSTWIKTLFPQQSKRRPAAKSRQSGPSPFIPAADALSEAAAATGYDASWIPAQHLSRPEAKRVGSGKPKTRAK